jgi:integrase
MLTTELVTSLTPPDHGNRITYDGAGGVAGFGVRITAAGAKSYVLNYRTRGGVERRRTIGPVNHWGANPKKAREEAKRLLRIIDAGGDPVADERADREAPTVRDLARRCIADHFCKKSPSLCKDVYGAAVDEHGDPVSGQLRKWILPAVGSLKVDAVRPRDVEAIHTAVTKAGSPVRANRVVSTLSRMFALALRWEWRTDGINPAKGAVNLNPEQGRKRYLSPDELSRLIAALAEYPDQVVADALRMMLLTGARPDEVMSARFEQFDGQTWTKQSSEVKQRRLHEVKVSPPVLEIIARRRAATKGEHLFPGRGQAHLTNVYKSWRHICRAAGLVNFRIYDLRHSAASFLVSGGLTLPVVGAILGHSKPSTTARYAHLLPNAQQSAVDTLGAIVTGKPSADVVSLRWKA